MQQSINVATNMKLYLSAFFSGLVAGIFLAPGKGSVTRQKISNFFSNIEKEYQRDIHAVERAIESAASRIDGLQQA